MPILDRIKRLKGKERTPPPKPFPGLKRDEFEKTMPVHEVAVTVAKLPEKKKLEFPEIIPKKEEKPKGDMNHIITKIVDDVAQSTAKTTAEDLSFLTENEKRKLFFDKIDRMIKEGKFTEEEIKNFSGKDLFLTMKEHYQKNRSGVPYLFDHEDFHEHVSSKVGQLKKLESEWQKTQDTMEETKKILESKEKEIGEHIASLKSLLGRYDDYERHKLLADASLPSAASLPSGDGIIHDAKPVPAAIAQEKNHFKESFLVFDKPLPPKFGFRLASGEVLSSLKELQDRLPQVPIQIIANHVNPRENHFVPWFGQFDNDVLVAEAKKVSSPQELVALVSRLRVVEPFHHLFP